MRVIGCAGQMRMGKTVLADYLCNKLNIRCNRTQINFGDKAQGNWTTVGFADNVKSVYRETFDVTNDFIEEWKVKPEPPPGFDMPVRQSLQFIGDGFRKIRKDIWMDLVFRNRSPKIIGDGRYPNEFIRVKEEGGLNILIGRPDKLNNDPNESESLIRPYLDWALNQEESKVNELLSTPLELDDCSEYMNKFDLFIRNDGTLEELYRKIDTMVVPFVENFNFK